MSILAKRQSHESATTRRMTGLLRFKSARLTATLQLSPPARIKACAQRPRSSASLVRTPLRPSRKDRPGVESPYLVQDAV